MCFCNQDVLTVSLSLSQSVVELIKNQFGHKISSPEPPPIPIYPVPSHEEPRFSCFVESEATGVSIEIILSLFCSN